MERIPHYSGRPVGRNYGKGGAHGKIGLEFAFGPLVLNDGSAMIFPRSTQLHFDFRAALTDGTIRRLLCVPETDAAYLRAELERRNISPATVG